MKKIKNSPTFAIGEMSKRTGVKIETVRYYEKINMMPKPRRSEGGNRLYNTEQLQRLFFIKRCRGNRIPPVRNKNAVVYG